MKRIIAFLLAFILIFALAACKKDNTSSDYSDTEGLANSEFVKPENYATVLLVTINPQFKLYLDETGIVLAVEPVNDDAKTIIKEIAFEKENFETVVKNIVTVANENDFVKADATVNFEITEIANSVIEKTDIINKATAALNQVATELKISISVATNDTDATSSTETVSKEQTDNSTSKVTTTKPTESHTHKMSNATCTEPMKCSCGATEGKALGHKYSYSHGICERCEAKDPDFVLYTSVMKKPGFWTCRYVINTDIGENLIDATLIFKAPTSEEYADYEDNMLFMGGSRLAEEGEVYDPSEAIEYNGKIYLGAYGNGGDRLGTVKEEGNMVYLTDADGNKLELLKTAENKLKVVSESNNYSDLRTIPTGTIITFSTTLE